MANSNQYQNSTSSSKNQNLPSYFSNAKNFNAFINSDELSYAEKETIINNFFSNIEEYSINDVAISFGNIGSNTEWDVDLISQFKHNMQEVIIKNPEILNLALKNLNSNEIEYFANFYLRNVIWNNDFPKEIYYLISHNTDAFKIFIKVFYELYQSMSTEVIDNKYIINDKDGQTNIRMESNSKSKIVGTLANDSEVSALWETGNWFFVYNDKNLGYVHLSNIIAADTDQKNLVTNNSSKIIILKTQADLNQDGIPDLIIATKPKNQDDRNFNADIEIYESKDNRFSLLKKNTTLFKEPVNGCMMEGLEDITATLDTFTIEYTSCYDNRYAQRKVSFTYDYQYNDFKIVDNKISFLDNGNQSSQTYDCNFKDYFFSSYDDSCEW